MNTLSFLKDHPLEKSLLLGFYGGGNYGDELLMEVLAGLLQKQGIRDVQIAYQHPERYGQFHHDFGYRRVNMHDYKAMLKAILTRKHIIVGGGGLWGMDTNRNILLMSVALMAARWLFGKRVYLLGVGYYNSAPRMGRVGAWCAAKAAHVILARDNETFANFKRLQKRTHKDRDMAWYIDQLDLSPYQKEVAHIEQRLQIQGKTLFISLRRFRDAAGQSLQKAVEQCLANNPKRHIVVALMEPRHVDPEGYRLLRSWQRAYPNIQTIDFAFNPIGLFLFFRKYHDRLVFIGPQFHAILSAYLADIPYLPVAYDNKVHNLLRQIAPHQTPVTIEGLRAMDVQRFIDTTLGETA
jgi:polysaccharide pyruvyl transferase WcaK-like protein